jgi:hypothetical protein
MALISRFSIVRIFGCAENIFHLNILHEQEWPWLQGRALPRRWYRTLPPLNLCCGMDPKVWPILRDTGTSASFASSYAVQLPVLMPGSKLSTPSFTTLLIRSTRNHRSNTDPIVTELVYCVSELCTFFHCPSTWANVRVQTLDPSLTTQCIVSTRNHRSNCDPIFA